MFKIGICAEMKNEADPTKQKWSFGTIFKVLGSIVVVFGTIYAATIWVQATARAAVLDEAFLATLSTRVRPICIFDSNGSIELDLGAGEYIDAKNIQGHTPSRHLRIFDQDSGKARSNLPALGIGPGCQLIPRKGRARQGLMIGTSF